MCPSLEPGDGVSPNQTKQSEGRGGVIPKGKLGSKHQMEDWELGNNNLQHAASAGSGPVLSALEGSELLLIRAWHHHTALVFASELPAEREL